MSGRTTAISNEILEQILGTVAPVPMGEWRQDTPYKKLNIVRYSGVSYMAKMDNTNICPYGASASDTVWQRLAADGRATIVDSSVLYQKGSSGTVAPTDGWNENIPELSRGEFLWAKVTLFYDDETTTTFYSVVQQPNDGVSVFIRYSASADGSNMTEVWQPTQRYIGLYVGVSAPITASDYSWHMFIGEFIPVDDNSTTAIEYTIENGVDKTFKAENIESFKLIIPATVSHGFSTVINISTGDNIVQVLAAENKSSYPLVYLRRGFPTTQFTQLAKNAITKFAIECDGINVNCFFVEIEK